MQAVDSECSGMSMQMQSSDDSSSGMSMQPASSSSASSQPQSDSDTIYRQIERQYKVSSLPTHLKRKGHSNSRFRTRMAHQHELNLAIEQEQSKWKPFTMDCRFLDNNSEENRARIIEHPRLVAPSPLPSPSPAALEAAAASSPVLPSWVSPRARVYSFKDIPGFHFIANALDETAQAWWSWRCLSHYSNAKHTNLTNLEELQKKEMAAQANDPSTPRSKENNFYAVGLKSLVTQSSGMWQTACQSGDFSALSKLRWSSLGFHYDWTHREYTAASRSPFPVELADLTAELATAAGFPTFQAEAAICNFYPATGSMGAHIDDAELTKLSPIVSLSLGCTGIFMLGGPTKRQKPMGFYVRAGDAVIMGGESRVCLHGVPRIIQGSFMRNGEPLLNTPGLDSSEKRQKQEAYSAAAAEEHKENQSEEQDSPSPFSGEVEWTPEVSYSKLRFREDAESGKPVVDFPAALPASLVPTKEELLHTLEFVSNARLNLNVREVEDRHFQFAKGMTSASARSMNLQAQQQLASSEGKEDTTTASLPTQ